MERVQERVRRLRPEPEGDTERRKPGNSKSRHYNRQVRGRDWEIGGENDKVNPYMETPKQRLSQWLSPHHNPKPKSVCT